MPIGICSDRASSSLDSQRLLVSRVLPRPAAIRRHIRWIVRFAHRAPQIAAYSVIRDSRKIRSYYGWHAYRLGLLFTLQRRRGPHNPASVGRSESSAVPWIHLGGSDRPAYGEQTLVNSTIATEKSLREIAGTPRQVLGQTPQRWTCCERYRGFVSWDQRASETHNRVSPRYNLSSLLVAKRARSNACTSARLTPCADEQSHTRSYTMTKQVADYNDFQLIAEIRKIEASPSAHRTWKMQQMVSERLAELCNEANRRGLKY